MTAYSKYQVSKETKGDSGPTLRQSGPVLNPSLHRTNRIFSPDQKLALVRWLDTLTAKQRLGVFRLKRNKWGIHPHMLRQWYSQFKCGKDFKLAWRVRCVSDAGIQHILDAIYKAEENSNPLSLPQVRALIQAEYEKEAIESEELFLKTLSPATLWRVLRDLRARYALAARPAPTTEALEKEPRGEARPWNFDFKQHRDNLSRLYEESKKKREEEERIASIPERKSKGKKTKLSLEAAKKQEAQEPKAVLEAPAICWRPSKRARDNTCIFCHKIVS